MTAKASRPSEETLHAYVDGLLGGQEQGVVERFLAEYPSEAIRIEAYRRQNAAFRVLADAVDSRPFAMPEFQARRQWLPRALRAAAVVALVLLGVGGGWWLRGLESTERVGWSDLAEQAAVAHQTYVPEVLHPVEVTSDQEKHLVTWLSKRLGNPVRAPSLRALGYDLVGGRLLPSSSGPAAQFMYQNARMNRITLYVLSSESGREETAFRFVRNGPVGVFYWISDTLDYALAGELERERLLEVATAIYKQLHNL